MELEREELRSRIFVALELSNLKWVVAVRLLGDVKTSLYQLSGGDLNGLMGLVDRVRAEADRRGHHDVEVCSCYEAGYDGFWLHRALEARGVRNRVLDSASIKVSRRRKHIKTDRIDARGMLAVLIALYRGEDDVCSVVRVPSEEEEDRKRIIRSRESLLRERVRRVNRIRSLLNLQGIGSINPNRTGWEAHLKDLKTFDGRSFPQRLLREIRREAVLLATVKRLLKQVDEEVRAMSEEEDPAAHRASGQSDRTTLVRVAGCRSANRGRARQRSLLSQLPEPTRDCELCRAFADALRQWWRQARPGD